jgi:peptidyl-prolyl cis-trans isomerase D
LVAQRTHAASVAYQENSMFDFFKNKAVTNAIYGVVLLGTAAAFVVNFGPNMGRDTPGIREAFNETCAVKVGGACVGPKVHRAVYRLLMPRDREGATDVKRARSMGLSKIVADGLIERELLIKEATRLGLTVTEAEVNESIVNGFIYLSLPSDNPMTSMYFRLDDGKLVAGFKDPKTKKFSEKAYEKQVKQYAGISTTEFKEWQMRELLAKKMRELVKSPVRLADEEAFSVFIKQKSTAQISHIDVTSAFASKYLVSDAPATIEAWAKEEAHKKEVDAEWEASKESMLPKENHIRHILIKVAPNADETDKKKAVEKAARAWERIKAGAAFASVAKVFSDDGSAGSGGDVGDKTDGFVEPFKLAANALKPGEMTDGAIETQFGLHIIMKDDPSKAAQVEAQIKKDIPRRLYFKERSEAQAKQLATSILARIKGGKAEDVAIKEELAPYAKAAAALLPIKIKDTSAEGDAGAAVASKWPAPAAWRADEDPERPQGKTSGAFPRGEAPLPYLEGDEGVKANTFAFESKEGELAPDVFKGDDVYLVVRQKSRKVATKEDFTKDRANFLEEMLGEKRNETLGLYVKRLRDTAKNEIKLFEERMIDGKPENPDGGAPKEEEADED